MQAQMAGTGTGEGVTESLNRTLVYGLEYPGHAGASPMAGPEGAMA